MKSISFRFFTLILMLTSAIFFSGCTDHTPPQTDYSRSLDNTACKLNDIVYYVDITQLFPLRAYNLTTQNESVLCKDPVCSHMEDCPTAVSSMTYYVTTDGYNLYFISGIMFYDERADEYMPKNILYRYNPIDFTCTSLVTMDATIGSSVSTIALDTAENGYVYFSEAYLENEEVLYRISRISKNGGNPQVCMEGYSPSYNFDLYGQDKLLYSDSKQLYLYEIDTGETIALGSGFINFSVYRDSVYGFTRQGKDENGQPVYTVSRADLTDLRNVTMEEIYGENHIKSIYIGPEGIYMLPNEYEYLFTRDPHFGEGDEPVKVYRANHGYYLKYSFNNKQITKIDLQDDALICAYLFYADDQNYIGTLNKMRAKTAFDEQYTGLYHAHSTGQGWMINRIESD